MLVAARKAFNDSSADFSGTPSTVSIEGKGVGIAVSAGGVESNTIGAGGGGGGGSISILAITGGGVVFSSGSLGGVGSTTGDGGTKTLSGPVMVFPGSELLLELFCSGVFAGVGGMTGGVAVLSSIFLEGSGSGWFAELVLAGMTFTGSPDDRPFGIRLRKNHSAIMASIRRKMTKPMTILRLPCARRSYVGIPDTCSKLTPRTGAFCRPGGNVGAERYDARASPIPMSARFSGGRSFQ